MAQNDAHVKRTVITSLMWRYGERMGAQVVGFVVSIILARLLEPEHYGVIGMLNIFIAVSNAIIISGLSSALIQKKNADNLDFSTVFYFNAGFSLLLYAIIFAVAPTISAFYEMPELCSTLRVLALSILVGAVNTVQHAYAARKMQFKRFFFSTIFGTIASGVVGIVMAYGGCGVWALVGQNLTSITISTIVLWFTVKWHPQRAFSWERLRTLYSFGWKVLVTKLLQTLYINVYALVIGKVYTTSDLGYYNRGKQWPLLILDEITNSIDSVLFTTLSKYQDEKQRVKAMVRRSIKTCTFLVMPMMAGLAAVARPLTILVLTEKWLPSVPFLQFCCFTYAFSPIETANIQAIKALGRSDILLKLEIISKTVGISMLLLTVRHGLMAMMVGRCFATVICSVVRIYPNSKLLGYSFFEQWRDFGPSFLLSLAMFAVVYTMEFLPLGQILVLFLQIIAGVLFYAFGAKLFKFESFDYLWNTAVAEIKKRKKPQAGTKEA
ncbi:MAG: lipopolysaccharide biosynthesis protein [Clostridia bacterium]|nr:lipopolysaccharide biosynthesis protein [Clostridia bacterium]